MMTNLQLLPLHRNIYGLVVPVHMLLGLAMPFYKRLLISQWMMRVMKEY